jgi:hypothetical protein
MNGKNRQRFLTFRLKFIRDLALITACAGDVFRGEACCLFFPITEPRFSLPVDVAATGNGPNTGANMKMRFLMTTALTLVVATAAFGQSSTTPPASSGTTPPAQSQNNPPASTPAPQAQTAPAQGTSTQNSQNSPASGSSNAANPSAGSTNPSGSSTASQNTSGQTGSGQAQTNPSGATGQTNQGQAQTAPSTSTPSTQQSANPARANAGQAQQNQSGTGNSGTTAQQPAAQGNAAQSPATNTNVNASVNINDRDRTRISQSVARLDVRPLTNVSFSLAVGTVVPRDVRLSTLPADVVEIVPQYRGYSFVLVKDEIVIVEPSTYKIVTVLPYTGRSTAAAPARERSKTSFTDRDRDAIRKHARTRSEGQTTGSAVRSEVRVGQRLPDSVEIETFPDEVYRESPGLREYRYLRRENRTYVVDPRERLIIEEID